MFEQVLERLTINWGNTLRALGPDYSIIESYATATTRPAPAIHARSSIHKSLFSCRALA